MKTGRFLSGRTFSVRPVWAAGWILMFILTSLWLLFPLQEAVAQTNNNEYEQVWNIDFEGNETYSGMVLHNMIALEAPSFFRKLRFWNRSGFEFDATELQRDEIRLERFYQRRGFPHVDVTSRVEQGRREESCHVFFMIEEGAPTVIDTVRQEINADPEVVEYLEEHREFQQADRSRRMQPGRRYQRIQHRDVEGRYLSVLRNLGFAYADANVTAEVDTLGGSAEVLITLTPGTRIYFGEIRVDGNETVSDDLVRRQSDLESGEMYSSDKMRTAQQHIYGHPLFRFVTLNLPSQPRDSVADVTLRVREHPLRSLQVQGGLGIEEIARLSVSWEHRNPLGNAHNFSVSTRASFLEQRANIDYLIPYVFNPKSRINIAPFGQRLDERAYLLLRGGVTNSFIYQISQETAGTISYEFTRNRELVRSSDVTIPEEKQQYNISALKLSGYHNQLEVERYQGWSIRSNAEFSGFLGTGSIHYNRYMLDIRRYIDLGSTTQLALRNDGGIITYSGLDELPSNIRFYAGGTSSVRGWQRRNLGPKRPIMDEDGEFDEYVPIGGKAMFQFNIELRQDLKWLIQQLGVAFFLDGGSVWEELGTIDTADLQYGLGGGFRYDSPVGPVRIDLARKINPTDEDLNIFEGKDYGSAFDHWGIHFSIGQAF